MKRIIVILGLAFVVVLIRVSMKGSVAFGMQIYDRRLLEERRAAGKPVNATVFGMAQFADDVTPDLVQAAVESLRVIGLLQLPKGIRSALAGRVTFTALVEPD